ncbi:MAG: divergent polysaccharide deacetylase family protein [Candidatus Cloacimonetes bacterium]|nr:divergent polysaccharide deacetylase family protein [Candidatus Cloacimonadota bacterium]
MALQRRLGIIFLLALLLLFACKKEAEKPRIAEAQARYEAELGELPEPVDSLPPAVPSLKNYKYTWDEAEGIPPLVIIIDDFGNSAGQLLEDFADLPPELVFAIIPDLSHTKTAVQAAQKGGHEAIIHVPMEAEDSKANPGKRYIKAGMPHDEISELMQDFIAQVPTAIAINNHMGSKATSDYHTMHSVISSLKYNWLFFVDSATTAKSAAFTAADELGIRYAKRDIFLDVPDVSDATLVQKINSLAKYKGRTEPIIIITHCHNRAKLDGLKKFITQVEEMGIRLISLRSAMRLISA